MKCRPPSFIVVAAVVLAGSYSRVEAQAPNAGLDRWKQDLVHLTRGGGTWRTSNAEYADADGGIDAFGMRYHLTPGGVASTGCLWTERQGRVVAVAWTFFQGWDPVAGKGLMYQSAQDGTVGIGYASPEAADAREVVQTFEGAGAPRITIRHLNTALGDTLNTASFHGQPGAWTLRRSYVWQRSVPDGAPC